MLLLHKRDEGYSLIEMFLVLMILAVFSITVFTLIFLGSDTYDNLIADKNNEADARIVLSTFDTRLRQYDYQGGCHVEEIIWQGHTIPALILSEIAAPDTIINTWLIWDEGILYESLTVNDEIPIPDTSQQLMENTNLGFSLDSDQGLIRVKVDYPFSGERKALETAFYPRSYQ